MLQVQPQNIMPHAMVSECNVNCITPQAIYMLFNSTQILVRNILYQISVKLFPKYRPIDTSD